MTAPAYADLDAVLRGVTGRVLAPVPPLTVSQWADRFRKLSSEAAAEPGDWRTQPYQREPMDAMSDPSVESVTIMWASQVGKSEILLCGMGYFADYDPCPMLFVQPTIDDAEKFSDTRIAPMIRDTAALQARFGSPKARDGTNKLTLKRFPGGMLKLAGANSPSGLASQPVRVVFNDEVDRYPDSAGDEGDPVQLSERRTSTFWNRKLVRVSSPGRLGESRIAKLYEASSQGERHLPCPRCAGYDVLRWRRDDGRYGLEFERTGDGDVVPGSTRYRCALCDGWVDETEKQRMDAEGRWVHRVPSRMADRGYHLSALVSPWFTWDDVARSFLKNRHNAETLKTFVNTVLGEPFADEGERLTPHALAARAEPMPDGVPPEVGALTAAVDVQGDRVEYLVCGWEAGETMSVLEWGQCWGDPTTEAPWDELDAILSQPRAGLKPRAICADTNYLTKSVWQWIDRTRLPVLGIKGMDGRGRALIVKPAITKERRSRKPWLVGVDTAKDLLAARLRQTEGPGRVRFADTLDPVWYEQVTAEEVVTVYVQGRPTRKWRLIKGRANEGLDLAVYNLAAFASLGPAFAQRLAALAAARHPDPNAPAAPAAPAPSLGPPSFVTKWRW